MTHLGRLEPILAGVLQIHGGEVSILDEGRLRDVVDRLVEISALDSGMEQGWARYIVRAAAHSLGIRLASIHDLYMARGRGQVPDTFTVPAMNLRVLSYDAAKAVFRVAKRLNAGPFLFEIARSEMGYTAQRPAEYATNVLAAAVSEGWHGPVFIQGDHFQLSAKKYAADPRAEMEAVKLLTQESVAAGFFNIDIDTSTLVEVDKPTVEQQQARNCALTAELLAHVRAIEPVGVTISAGGEIGEVGGHNSTAEELRTFMDGLAAELARLGVKQPGPSKISIQTGTSHGGTVLADGSLAKVSIDFETLQSLSELARRNYGMSGAVQHGASTLPEDAFHKFVEHKAVEVHLATSFMTMFYENAPAELRKEMYAWLDQNSAAERKPGMTDDQFYYKARKNAIGPFKKQMYALRRDQRAKIAVAWEAQFQKLFELLGMRDTRRYCDQFIGAVDVKPDLAFYLGKEAAAEAADDLAD